VKQLLSVVLALQPCGHIVQTHDSSAAAPPSNMQGRNDLDVSDSGLSHSSEDSDGESNGAGAESRATSATGASAPASAHGDGAGLRRRRRRRRRKNSKAAIEKAEVYASEAMAPPKSGAEEALRRQDVKPGHGHSERGVSMGGVFSVFDYFLLRALLLCCCCSAASAWCARAAWLQQYRPRFTVGIICCSVASASASLSLIISGMCTLQDVSVSFLACARVSGRTAALGDQNLPERLNLAP
jgi:hypothetical protein